MKARSRQQEADFGGPEPFALVAETTRDGERITQARRQSEQDRAEAESRQETLFADNRT